MSPPMPGPVTPVRGWPGPPSMRMICGRMISKPRTHQSAILDDEVPWYEFIIPLMVGTEGVALSLAKHLLMVWQWSIKVEGWDVCPPTLTALNIRQFMTREEVLEGVDDFLWFAAYSCTLQRVGEAAHG